MESMLLEKTVGAVYPSPPVNSVLYLPGYPPTGGIIHDRSGSGNNGTINGATWERLPSGLWVLNFDGTTSYVDLGNPASLNFTGSFTFMAWVYFNKTTSTQQLWCKDTVAAGGRQILTYFAATKLQTYIFKTDAIISNINSSTALGTGVWYHVALVYTSIGDGSSLLDVYLNGVPDATQITNAISPIRSTAANWGLGANDVAATPAEFLYGKMGLVKAFNVPSTATQIAAYRQQERHLLGV